MPDLRTKYFAVTGGASAEALDTGKLTGKAGELRHCSRIFVQLSGYASGNKVIVYLNEDKIHELPDKLFDTEASSGSTNVQYSTKKMQAIDIDRELAEGDELIAGIACGATAKNLLGAYEWYVK